MLLQSLKHNSHFATSPICDERMNARLRRDCYTRKCCKCNKQSTRKHNAVTLQLITMTRCEGNTLSTSAQHSEHGQHSVERAAISELKWSRCNYSTGLFDAIFSSHLLVQTPFPSWGHIHSPWFIFQPWRNSMHFKSTAWRMNFWSIFAWVTISAFGSPQVMANVFFPTTGLWDRDCPLPGVTERLA